MLDQYWEMFMKTTPRTIPPFSLYLMNKGLEVYDPGHIVKIKDPTEMTPTAIILCGVPTSGKSTWIRKNLAPTGEMRNAGTRYTVLSRDYLREITYGKNYKPSSKSESHITEVFNRQVGIYIENNQSVVIDNTHAREKYLKEIIKTFFDAGYIVKVKFFDIPLWKAYYRNIKRGLQTGKWIPVKVIKSMKESYDKINQKGYEKYSL